MKFSRLLLAVVLFLSIALRHAYAEDKLAIASFSTILTEIAQKVGNGAIVALLTCGRPNCDGGQAVKKLERIRHRIGRPRNSR